MPQTLVRAQVLNDSNSQAKVLVAASETLIFAGALSHRGAAFAETSHLLE